MKTALVIQHNPHEELGVLYASILNEYDFCIQTVTSFDGFFFSNAPELSTIDLIISLVGHQSVNDEDVFLIREQKYLYQATIMDIPIFAICLGAQLLAAAFEASIFPTGGYQFGLRKIYVTEDGDIDPVFKNFTIPLVPTMHGETFTLPNGEVKLADGYMLCRDGSYEKINMAFRIGKSYGFQFEPHLMLDQFTVWNEKMADDYEYMGRNFDPVEQSGINLREFTKYEQHFTVQSEQVFNSFLDTFIN